MLFQPDYLKAGDTIAIISTARKISIAEIQPAIDIFESWGLKVRIGKTIGAAEHQFAGEDAWRAADFQDMLDDDDIKAIVMGRGGYGTVRMMDKINYHHFVAHPKWIVGYSDITFLHNYINQFFGIQTMHATMPINFPTNTSEAIQSLRSALFGEEQIIRFEGKTMNYSKEITGEILGGNLSIYYAMLGTTNGFNLNDKILMIEDLDEYLYHIDRMMMSMKLAGKLQGLKALVVGGMSDMKDNAIPFGKTAEEIIKEHCSPYGYPIIFNAPIGHIANNHAIKLGNEITLRKSPDSNLIEMVV
ncbi:MAG: LD-carboxypeptidase [Bacteroidetes bacterium]|nr:LD-carboxypeptidase [Bacteroidota bacterium]